jgi:CRISPR-associated protein Csb1
MTTLEILRGGKHCLTLKAILEPVGDTKRFQPAGFPEIGHVIYKAPTEVEGTTEDVCIIDSAASMANHLTETPNVWFVQPSRKVIDWPRIIFSKEH